MNLQKLMIGTKITIILLTISYRCVCQNFIGEYNSYWADQLKLYKDSTFLYIHKYGCSIQIKEKGIWNESLDTIYLFYTPAIQSYDTTSVNNEDIKKSILIRSVNPKIDSTLFEKLFFKNDKLFPVDINGKLKKYDKNAFEKRYLSIRNHNLIKPKIILFQWKKKFPIYYYKVLKK